MKRRLLPVLLLCILVAGAGSARAAGFAIIEQSVTGLGNAFAGQSAAAEDASTVYYNPAGMTRLSGRQALVGLHYVAPSARFHKTAASNALGQAISGGDGGDGGRAGLVPNLFLTAGLGRRLALGLGVTAPFGLTTEYPADWVGRYHAVKSQLRTVNLNPALACRVNDHLSVGAGISAQYIDVELSSMVDFGLVAYQQSGGNAALLPLVSNHDADVYSDLKADDWGYGFNLGLLYAFTDGTRLGAAYRSRIHHTLKGDARFSLVNQPLLALYGLDTAALSQFQQQGVLGKITLPASASLSFFSQLNPQWAVMADVMWTDWSSFEKLVIRFDGTLAATPSVTTENWKDSWRYAVGTTYTPNDTCTLRLGLAYDQSPIPDAYRTPRIPGEDRIWAALGGGYRFTDRLRLDLAYVHLFVKDGRVEKSAATPEDAGRGTLQGSFANAVEIVSAQLGYAF